MLHAPDIIEEGLYSRLLDAAEKISADRPKILVEQFFRFIYLVSKNGSTFIPVSKEVDEIWHAAILQTRSYARLCDGLPGRRFIHHESGSFDSYVSSRDKTETVERMLRWIPEYIEVFGKFDDHSAAYWTPIRLLLEKGLSLDQINKITRGEHV